MGGQRKTRTDDVPTLSVDERDRRWAKIRAEMIARDIDCLLFWANDHSFGMGRANLRYTTQVPGQVGPAVGIFPLHDHPRVFTDPPHFHKPSNPYVLYQDWTQDVRPFVGIDPVLKELEDLGIGNDRIGLVGFGNMLVPSSLPQELFKDLRQAFPHTDLVNAEDILSRLRVQKSEEEIELLRQAGDIAHEMLERLMEADVGKTEAEVHADMVHEQIARGGEAYIFNLLDSGNPTADDEHHLLHGKAQPLSPTQRSLEEGDLLITEFHAGVAGYLAAAEMSVAIGSAPPELKDIHDVALQCLDNGFKKFTPGTRLEEVWDAIRQPVYEADMDFIELGFHGHGLGSPEFPTVLYPEDGNRTYPEGFPDNPVAGSGIRDMRLEEGMVFGTNIDIYDPDWRQDVGLMFGDMVLVTEHGPELLVNTPRDFVV